MLGSGPHPQREFGTAITVETHTGMGKTTRAAAGILRRLTSHAMKTPSGRIPIPFVIALLLVSVPLHARAQVQIGTVEGVVLDPDGAVVPDAGLQLREPLTGARYMTGSDSAGRRSGTRWSSIGGGSTAAGPSLQGAPLPV